MGIRTAAVLVESEMSQKQLKKSTLLGFVALFCALMSFLGTARLIGAPVFESGPLIHDFENTLSGGIRREIAGPIYYREQAGSKRTRAFPPFVSRTDDPDLDYTEVDVLYPVFTYDRFGKESRVQLFQMLSLSDSSEQDDSVRQKLSFFPLYFQQRSTNSAKDYTALFPFYGTLKNRMLRDEIKFVMFPAYGMSRKRDVVTRNYLYPFFHLREGNHLQGWQFWPLVGRETREPHTITNDYGFEVHVPGHRKEFALSPFLFRNHLDIGTTNEVRETAVLPLVSLSRSPARDSSVYLWPFLKFTNDKANQYREWGFPWPLWVIARGEGKHMNRFWPLFSQARKGDLEGVFYLWPFWKEKRALAAPLDRRRTRIMFFLYSDIVERNTDTGEAMQRRDLWPLFTYRKELDGRERLQALSLLAPLLPNNKSVERNYSPLWALWRTEKNPATATRSDSLLWNLWRREITPGQRKNSYFFGLLRSTKTDDGTDWTWFHFRRQRGERPNESPSAVPVGSKELQPQIGPISIRPVSEMKFES